MIVLLAAHVSMNAPLEQSLRAKSIQLIPSSAQSVVLVQMLAQVVLFLFKKPLSHTLPQMGGFIVPVHNHI